MPAKQPDAPEAPETPQTFPLTLEEFCARLSSSDSRVEMIAGFYSVERLAEHFKDEVEAYQARYEAFQTAPA